MALGYCFLAWRDPLYPAERPAGDLLLALAVGSASCAWLAALIGLWVTLVRAI